MHADIQTTTIYRLPEPGGSACCYWNGYGAQRNHPAQTMRAFKPSGRHQAQCNASSDSTEPVVLTRTLWNCTGSVSVYLSLPLSCLCCRRSLPLCLSPLPLSIVFLLCMLWSASCCPPAVVVDRSADAVRLARSGEPACSRRREPCHFPDTRSPSILKRLTKGEYDVAEWQSRRRVCPPARPRTAPPRPRRGRPASAPAPSLRPWAGRCPSPPPPAQGPRRRRSPACPADRADN